MICGTNGIEDRLAKPKQRWTNDQVEGMNRTIKHVTVKRFQCHSHDPLRTHLPDVMAACNFARRLRTPGCLAPSEYTCKIPTSAPDRTSLDPIFKR